MKRLEQREWACIDEIIYFNHSSYDLISHSNRKTFLSYLHQLIPNSFSVFHLADKTGKHFLCDPVVFVDGEKNGATKRQIDAIDRYIENYEDEDFGKWLMTMGKCEVYRESDLIDDHEMKSTGYFNDTYAIFDVKYSLQVISAHNKEFQAAIVLGRSKEAGDFTDKEIYMMTLLNRHLSLKLYQQSIRVSTENIRIDSRLDENVNEIANSCSLTKKETEIVCNIIKENLSNEEICTELSIAKSTLNKHLSNIYGKCCVNSRTDLIHKVLAQITH